MIDTATQIEMLTTAIALMVIVVVGIVWLMWYVPWKLNQAATLLKEAEEEDEIA